MVRSAHGTTRAGYTQPCPQPRWKLPGANSRSGASTSGSGHTAAATTPVSRSPRSISQPHRPAAFTYTQPGSRPTTSTRAPANTCPIANDPGALRSDAHGRWTENRSEAAALTGAASHRQTTRIRLRRTRCSGYADALPDGGAMPVRLEREHERVAPVREAMRAHPQRDPAAAVRAGHARDDLAAAAERRTHARARGGRQLHRAGDRHLRALDLARLAGDD